MKIVLYLLLILSFPLGVLTRFSITPSVHIYLQDMWVVFIIAFCSQTIFPYIYKTRSSIKYAAVLLLCISTIGVLTHTSTLSEFVISILYTVRLAGYILLIIPLLSFSLKGLQIIKRSMLVSGFIFVFFGYLQYIFYPNLRNLYYLGWDEHLYRLFSTLLDPNFAGIYILLILLFFLSYVFQNFRHSNFFSRFFYVMALIFLSASIFLTYSRSVYITTIVSLIFYVYLLGYKKLVILIGGVFLFGLLMLPYNLGGEGVNLLRTASIFARIESNIQGLVIFINNPIIGVGYNSLRYVQLDYGFIDFKNSLTSHAASGFPNSYIVLLATTGLLGFVLILFILRKLLKYLTLKNDTRHMNILRTTVFISIFCIMLHAIFENTLFYGPIIIWMSILIGIYFGLRRKNA